MVLKFKAMERVRVRNLLKVLKNRKIGGCLHVHMCLCVFAFVYVCA